MKAVWKWILGVVLVLVVIAGLAAAAFFWHARWTTVSFREMPYGRGWNAGPMMREGGLPWRQGPMMRGDDFTWRQGPMMRIERGFGPFGGFFFLGGLLRWVFFGALLYGAYWLGRRNARVVVDPRTTAAPPAVPAQASASDANPPAPESGA